jgi:hypothetical protein
MKKKGKIVALTAILLALPAIILWGGFGESHSTEPVAEAREVIVTPTPTPSLNTPAAVAPISPEEEPLPSQIPMPTLTSAPAPIQMNDILPKTVVIGGLELKDWQRDNVIAVFEEFVKRGASAVEAIAWCGVFGTESTFDLQPKPGDAGKSHGAFQMRGAILDAHLTEYPNDSWSAENQVNTIWRVYTDDDFCRQYEIKPSSEAREKIELALDNFREEAKKHLLVLGEAGKELFESGTSNKPIDPEDQAQYDALCQNAEMEFTGEMAAIFERYVERGSGASRARDWAKELHKQIDFAVVDALMAP